MIGLRRPGLDADPSWGCLRTPIVDQETIIDLGQRLFRDACGLSPLSAAQYGRVDLLMAKTSRISLLRMFELLLKVRRTGDELELGTIAPIAQSVPSGVW